MITGTDYGIEGYKLGNIVNREGAEICGGFVGIDVGGGTSTTIRNACRIHSNELAIDATAQSADVKIINHGRIEGDITLGDGNDVIDIRHGKLKGTVSGGERDDAYFISGTVKIIEDGESFGDILKSTVSAGLMGTGIDDLYLLGKKDLDGLGNDGNNLIVGNRGDNVLTGGLGDDILSGGRGHDLLSGGLGADVFRFRRGNAVDKISDFEDGLDLIGVEDGFRMRYVTVEQRGKNVLVDFGDGDHLILKNFSEVDVSVADFGLES